MERTQIFNQRIWQGGLNTSLDPVLLSPDELTIADNIIFTTSGARKSRGGFKFWAYSGVGVTRSSSSTTRTIRVTFNDVSDVPTDMDSIAIWHDGYNINSNYDNKKVAINTIVNVSGTTYDITYTASTSLTEASTADTDIRVIAYNSNKSIIGMKDFWYYEAGTKVQKRISVMADGTFYSYSSTGSRTPISTSGLSLSLPLTNASFAVLGNELLIALSGGSSSQNRPVLYTGGGSIIHPSNLDFNDVSVETTNPFPNLQFLQVYQGRIVATDKTDPDRLLFSDVGEAKRWNGEGDSGVIVLDGGDDDSSGISAIFPPFQDRLLFAKNNKLYQLFGDLPLIGAKIISSGIGCFSHFSTVAVDQNDVFFVSKKGIHSVQTTSNYGDFSGSFVSDPIQTTFNNLELSALNDVWSTYLSRLNSIVWSFREDSEARNNIMYLLNIAKGVGNTGANQRWYKWSSSEPEFTIQSMEKFQEDNVDKFTIGTSEGIILLYKEDEIYDFINSTINYNIKSGTIYVDNDPTKVKGYKKVGIMYKLEENNVSFNLRVKIDNYDEQVFAVSSSILSDLLGSTFLLGTSLLGVVSVLLPDYIYIDGYGFGLSIEIDSTQPLEIYGYSIEWEQAGTSAETER